MLKNETKKKILLNMYGSINNHVFNDLGNIITATYEDLKNLTITISLVDNVKFNKKEIEVLKDLKNLKELDLKDYNCKGKIPFELYDTLTKNGVKIILNNNVTYDNKIEYLKARKEKEELLKEKKYLLQKLEHIEFNLNSKDKVLKKLKKEILKEKKTKNNEQEI